MITALKGFIEIVYPEKDGIPGVYLKLLVGGPNGDEIWCCCSYEDIKKVIMKAMK